jgi:mannose-1-phosphate guanylyltransferase / phosphomannomutase
MKAVIIAGGKGKRLSSSIGNIPKGLVKIGNKPIIEHQLLLLKREGIKEVYFLLGYLGEQIKEHFGNGEKWKIKIHYFQEKKPLGSAGALRQLKNRIKEDFLVFSCDVMTDFDIKRFINWHKKKKGIVSIVSHPNDHPFDSDLLETDKNERVITLLKRPHLSNLVFKNLTIASVFIFSPRIFKYIPKNKKCDIEKDILPKVLKNKEKIYAYNTPEYLKDMGTLERLRRVRKDYQIGKIAKMNLKNKRKAVFLDRDGVINKEIDQLSKIEYFKIYSFVAKAIKKINESDYLIILITNQPMIAKGFIKEKELEMIHKKLETELGRQGAKIDAIYYCPHHPEKGFKGEIKKFKIKCNCRKPEIGMLIQAKKDFNIDLKKSFLIGDKTSDILAGKKAGCQTILVKTGYAGKDKRHSVKPDFIADNLFQAVKKIL